MKKLLLILLLGVATNTYSQLKPKAQISYEINPAYKIKQTQPQTYTMALLGINNNTEILYKVPPIIIKYGLEYKFKRLSAYFDNTIDCDLKGSPLPGNFSPQQIMFVIGVKYRITKDITFSVEHMCSHTINPDIDNIESVRYSGSYDKISLSYGY